jgi:hydrogenase-4 component E
MSLLVDTSLSLVLFSVLIALGAGRLPGLIRVVAFQGVVVSMVPLLIGHNLSAGGIAFTVATLVIRGLLIPLAIYLAIRRKAIRQEVDPIVGPHASLLLGLVLIVAATWVGRSFHLPSADHSNLLLPTAISLLVAGMFLLMARRNAIAMVLGYVMLENGIYVVGTTFSARTHHIVEFGILLDVLAGVMIMAILLQHIKLAAGDVHTSLLRSLKD